MSGQDDDLSKSRELRGLSSSVVLYFHTSKSAVRCYFMAESIVGKFMLCLFENIYNNSDYYREI